MSNALWIAILISAAGTYLMRLLPLLWMQRRLRRWDDDDREALPQWLSILGPMMIAAVLGVSLAPDHASISAWLATAAGAIATLAAWYRLRSLGWPVAAGVTAYGTTLVAIGML